MEDVLDVYQRPYDPLRPVVCLDETNRQLIEKRSIPPKPGNPEREDYEYRRCGVVDLFVAFEPLACKRVVKLTDTRTAVDFAHFLRELIEVHYSHCEKIVLVMDNLNIHSIASLYKVFDPATARPVSYTHLDVYKRQGWESGTFALKTMEPNSHLRSFRNCSRNWTARTRRWKPLP